MKIIEKPWGREIILVEDKDYIVKELIVNPGQQLSLQYHKFKKEAMFLIDGVGQLQIGSKCHNMIRLEPYLIESNTIHRLMAPTASTHCRVVEISSNHPDDVVRLEDDYNRK